MFHFAVINNGHSLETAMRVLANAQPLIRRREFHRAGIIEEQKRTEHRSQIRVGKERADREPVADPVPVRAALDACGVS